MPAHTSKAQQELDQALEDIGRVYTPEASREAMASAVGQALETLADHEDDDEDAETDEEEQ